MKIPCKDPRLQVIVHAIHSVSIVDHVVSVVDVQIVAIVVDVHVVATVDHTVAVVGVVVHSSYTRKEEEMWHSEGALVLRHLTHLIHI